MTKFISIISGNGGTGKTFVAVNLALALSHLGRDVTLVDANLHTPNVGYHLGFPHVSANLHDFLENKNKIEDAIYLHPSGLKVIPGSGSLRLVEDVYHQNLKNLFSSLIGKTEIAILDSASGPTRETSSLIKNSDESIAVLNQQGHSILDTKKMIAYAENIGGSVVGCIVNKYDKNINPTFDKIQSILNKPVVSAVAYDRHILKSLELKHPVFLHEPQAPSSMEFLKLANLLNINETK